MQLTAGLLVSILPVLAAAVDYQIVFKQCIEPISGSSDEHYVVWHAGESGCAGCTYEESDDGSGNWAISNTGAEGCDYGFTGPSDFSTFSTPDGRSGTCTHNGVTDACQTVSVACAEIIEMDCAYS